MYKRQVTKLADASGWHKASGNKIMLKQVSNPFGIFLVHKAIQTCAALMEQLSQRLSKEDYALVEELRAQNAIAQCEESESHFKYGFSAGLIVQQEAHEQLQNKK